MPPMHSGDTGEGQGEDGLEFRPPLPPEDRIWRHPSEVASAPAIRGRGRVATEHRGPRTIGLVAVSGLIGATLSLGVVAALGGFGHDTTVVERNVAIQPVTSTDSRTDSVAAIATRTGPTIAGLLIERDGTSVSASAIVLRSDGYLLTNAHVIDGADAIEARVEDGTAGAATVVGTDPITDIAVLHIDAGDLEPAALGSADAIGVGDQAIAIGVAGAGRHWSTEVATGIIRGLDRRLRLPDGTTLHDMILIEVFLADGTAGGPLLDAGGAVVGITSAVPAESDSARLQASAGRQESIGVATPIDLARRVADQIIQHGRARHVWLGVEGSDLALSTAAEMGIAGGASISRVAGASPAAAAGLVDGDVIVALDDDPIDSMSDLIAALHTREPGDEVTVTVRRGDETLSTLVVLAEKSD